MINFQRKMNEKFCAPTAITNGEIKQNGDMKSTAPGDDCGVEDSLKICLGSNDSLKSRECVSDLKSNLKSNSNVSVDSPASNENADVSNCDSLQAKVISKQVDTCEPDSKASDLLVEDPADTSTENEVEDDFKLALSPEASGTESFTEQNQEDSTVQSTKPSASSNLSKDMETDELKVSEETDCSSLGNKFPDIPKSSDVNVGSDSNNCAVTVGEGKSCGDAAVIVDNDSKSDVCAGEHLNKQSESDALLNLSKEAAVSVSEIEKSNSQDPTTSSAVADESNGAVQTTNVEDGQESLTTDKSTNSKNDVESVLDDLKENNLANSSGSKDGIENEISYTIESSDQEMQIDKDGSSVAKEVVPKTDSTCVEKLEDKISMESTNISESRNNKEDEPAKSDEDTLLNSPEVNASLSCKPIDDSDDKIEKAKEEALLVSPDKIADKNSEEIQDDALLKTSEKEMNDDEVIDMEEEAALLNSPDCKANRSNLPEEETESLEDEIEPLEDDLLNSPEPKKPESDETETKLDDQMYDDDLLNSPSKKIIVENGEKNNLNEEKIEDELTPNSPKNNIDSPHKVDDVAAPEKIEDELAPNSPKINIGAPHKVDDVAASEKMEEDIVGSVLDNEVDTTKIQEDGSIKAKDEREATKSPVCQVTDSNASKNSEATNKIDLSITAPDSVKVVESMELDLEADVSKAKDENEATKFPACQVTDGTVSKNCEVSNEIDSSITAADSVKVAEPMELDPEEDVSTKARDESEATKSPACQVSDSNVSENVETSNKTESSMAAAASVKVAESMELDPLDSKDSISAKEDAADSTEKKSELSLELNGTSDSSDHSDIKSSNFCSNSSKDQEAATPMTFCRKRAHSPVVGSQSREPDEKSKFARMVNGYDGNSSNEDAIKPEGDSVVSSEKKKCGLDLDILNDVDSKISTTEKLNSSDIKVPTESGVGDVTTKPEPEPKTEEDTKDSGSSVSRVNLSYLRKLHKGQVEKMSRNDLEELVVQKLCEAITERSQVGEMRLRCQALERGQEKWKDKYSQLQKQVRELNIVIKKFLSEQTTAVKEKTIPPTPVRITRSVGLQVALPGSGQRSLAALRLRQQRDAAANNASATPSNTCTTPTSTATNDSTVSPVSTATSVSAATNVSTAQSLALTRSVIAQASARRLQDVPTQTTSSGITPLQRQVPVNSVSSTSTVCAASATPPRVASAPQICYPVSRPQMTPQVQPQIQTAQVTNIRPRANLNAGVRPQTQPHILHQVQHRQPPLQPGQHTAVSQVVVSTSSTPQIGRLQVVLAPQQQQQLLQQQQIVLRQSQSSSKDVEIIDLDKDERSRQPNRVQQLQQVPTAPSYPTNGNMTVRLLPNPQQSGVPQSHMTLLVPATAQQQKMIITSTPSTVQINSNQGKSRTNPGVLFKGVVQAMPTQAGSAVRQQTVVQPGTIIPSRGLTIVQPPQQVQQQMPQLQQLRPIRVTSAHPAPLPPPPTVQPENHTWKMAPPKPSLKIQHTENGIVLSWNMNLHSSYEDIDTYQLYAYQEGTSPPSSSLWKKVGDVKALPLPMACTLTQFAEGHRYHFAVRAVDVRHRVGPFSAPGNIRLEQKTQ